MKGAVAAGHPLTAQAGARALAQGGNAVDACVAAAFAVAVTESPLTSPGAGGFMLVHRASRRHDPACRLLRLRSWARPERQRHGEMQVVDVGFGEARRPSRSASARRRVPSPARLPASRRRTARSGACRGASCLRRRSSSRATASSSRARRRTCMRCSTRSFGSGGGPPHLQRPNGERLVAGDTLRLPELADTLEAIATRGAAVLYRGERARAIVADGARRRRRADARRPRALPRRLAPAGPRPLPWLGRSSRTHRLRRGAC